MLAFTACEPEINEDLNFNAGNLNVETYLAVGDDFTAGVFSNGLTQNSQENSFANILAQQFKRVGGGNFNQPLMPMGAGSGEYSIGSIDPNFCEGSSPQPVINRGEADAAWKNNIYEQGAFNNLGVQRMKLTSVLDKSWSTFAFNNIDSLNDNGAYLARMSPAGFEDTTSYNDLTMQTLDALQPSFFTCWLGISDVLLFAASGGGLISGETGVLPGYSCDIDLGELSPSTLTNPTVFEENYRVLIQTLTTSNSIEGALIGIPNILNFPYFRAVTEGTIGADGKLQVKEFGDCDNPHDIWMKSGDSVRVALHEDLILLPAYFTMGNSPGVPCSNPQAMPDEPHGLHEGNPLLNSEVLTAAEAELVSKAISDFNEIIKALAEEFGLMYIDVNSFYDKYNDNHVAAGVDYNREFLTGNIYSLDGFHFTARGNAFFANYIIEQLNSHYLANIPMAEPTAFDVIAFP